MNRARTKAKPPAAERPAKMGRPSKFTEETADYIVGQMIEQGRSLVDICGDEGMPGRVTVYRWLAAHPEFAARVDRAREAIGDHAVWKARQVVEAVKPETANADRVKIQHWQWEASRMNPNKYSEKRIAELVGKGGGPIQTEDTTPKPVDLSHLSRDERDELRTLLKRIAGPQGAGDET